MYLEGKVAIVTGAGRGIGYAIAERLIVEGATVAVAEKDEGPAEAAARTLGSKANAYAVDVADPEAVGRVFDDVVARQGRIDILVNNAGLFIIGRALEQSEADWRLQVDVMLNGVFFCSQAAAQRMIPRGGGAIVNVASIGGLGGWPQRGPYNAAKAGVVNLTETLGCEWAQVGIRVNAVAPGVIRTPMMQVAIEKGQANLPSYEARHAMHKVGEPQDVASAVAFLASERASFITGTTLRVDGGWVPWAGVESEVPMHG